MGSEHEEWPVPEDEFCVFGVVYCKPEYADDLEKLYSETSRLARSEPGIVYYCISRDPDDPTAFHFFERYTGKEAFDQHNQTPLIRQLLADQWFTDVKAKFMKPIGPSGV